MPRPMVQGNPTQLGKLFNGGLASKTPITAGLDPTKRHLGFIVHRGTVDMTNTRLHALCQCQGTTGISTEDGGSQTER
ncbi:hypothetical protein D3C71_1648210 [compost metagenome]